MGRIFCFPVFSRKRKAKLPFPKALDSANAAESGSKDNHSEVPEDASSSQDQGPKDTHSEALEELDRGTGDAHSEMLEVTSTNHQTKLNNGEESSTNSSEDRDNMLACCAVLKDAERLSDPGVFAPDAMCAASEASPSSQESDVPSEVQKGCGTTAAESQTNGGEPSAGPSSVSESIREDDDDAASYMRRVGEWVKSIEITEEPLIEQLPPVEDSRPSLRSVQRKDLELANNAARSLDIHSTAAHLNNAGLTVMPSLGAFVSLRVLKLSGNCITKISPGCLPKSLHLLDLSRNKISVIEGLRELTRLRTLNLSYNRISRIGQGLANCTAIRELHLAGNKLSEVEGLHRLTKLTCLDVSFNRLASLKSLEQLAASYTSLVCLDLAGNPMVANVGEEHLKRFVTGLAPNLAYLNRRQLTKGSRVRSSSQW